MDKVKKYWQTVIKEREGYWNSLFSKLAVGNEEDATSEHPCTKVTQYHEEQPCDVKDANIQLCDDGNQEAKQRELTNSNHPVAQVKRAKPAYVVEITADEEDEKWKLILHSTKKLKLCDSSMKTKHDMDDFVTDDQSSQVISSGSPLSEALNESFATNVSKQSEPLRYVCRRFKPGSSNAPSPKRFKLV
ncbi:uncharacterized protein LOC116915882 isoform X4 [Daphnia magna]|uniref:uncharacterized protein LOC116915882 isoform X4 n=1 Tax=Daphnia magna TaxID=35525 RepID=UPI0006E87D79|nr:uncharacterized protein LOC116915882 isoform X4 [Daphnia magna]